ncbi:MAG: hypothetical protein ACOCXQ_02575 [Patescibacteria group bacterium]
MDSISSRISPKVLVILAVGFLLFIIALFALLTQFSSQQSNAPIETDEDTTSSNTNSSAPQFTGEDNPGNNSDETSVRLDRAEDPPEPDVIAVVGDEYLYSEDFNTEIAYTRGTVTSSEEEEILQKMILDSIILQAAAEENLIRLDASIFNSRDKDYAKRTQTIRKIEDTLNQQAVALEGELITVWFNNVVPGPAGYEAGKQIAFNKISDVHEQVKAGQITMEQAGQLLQQDEEVAQADPSWRANAYGEFSAQAGDRISADEKVSDQIKSLAEGDVSDILTGNGQDARSGELIPSFYSFAFVSLKKSGGIGSYDEWLSSKLNTYETAIY